jgi:hypothetical protein
MILMIKSRRMRVLNNVIDNGRKDFGELRRRERRDLLQLVQEQFDRSIKLYQYHIEISEISICKIRLQRIALICICLYSNIHPSSGRQQTIQYYYKQRFIRSNFSIYRRIIIFYLIVFQNYLLYYLIIPIPL